MELWRYTPLHLVGRDYVDNSWTNSDAATIYQDLGYIPVVRTIIPPIILLLLSIIQPI